MRIAIFTALLLGSVSVVAPQTATPSPEPDERRFRRVYNFTWPPKLTREQRQSLAPRSEEMARFRYFLQLPSTGIFRLRPDTGCFRNPAVLRADDKCAEAIPGSSHYSFRRKRDMPEALSDVRLNNGFLVSDGALAQGIMVNLGDIPVENVGFETPGIGFIRTYSPSEQIEVLQRDFVRFFNGVKDGQFEYRVALPAEVDSTYVLRVVALRGSIYRQARGFRYDVLADDTRVDVLIVFRVVHRDDDGTLTLIFREIERKKSPRIRRTGRK